MQELPRRLIAALISSMMLGGCLASGPSLVPPPIASVSTSTGPSSTPDLAVATPTPARTVTPTPPPSISAARFVDELPDLRMDPSKTLGVCDPPPGVQLTEPGEAVLFCWDGIDAGLRAIETTVADPIDRAYLDLPTCLVAPCTPEQLRTGTLTAWSADRAWSTFLDARGPRWTATAPEPVDGSTWPAIAGPSPAGFGPALDRVPAEILNRKLLPFCGQAEDGRPPEVQRCFLAAVLAGRPAEQLDLQHGTEGGTSLQIARFTGGGPIVIYQQHLDDRGRTGPWFRQSARLIIELEGTSWSPDPIDGTFRDLP